MTRGGVERSNSDWIATCGGLPRSPLCVLGWAAWSAGDDETRERWLEASALVLGHGSARVTDAVYAERDQTKVVGIMRLVG